MKPLVSRSPGRVVLAGLIALLIGAAPPPVVVRQPPRVLVPVESAAAVARVGVRSYIFDRSFTSIYALEPVKDAGKEKQLVPIRLNRLERQANVHLAETMYPLRLVVIAAGFSYQEQVKEFRGWLGLPSVADVLTRKGPDGALLFRFLGVDLQRRTLHGGGKPATDYQPIDLAASFRPLVFLTGKRFEPDPAEHEPVIVPGLVMPRLALFTGGYPAVEERLPHLDSAIRNFGQLPERFRFHDFDVFRPARKLAPGVAKPTRLVEIPDTCLLRVLDVTVEPAHTYQYRLRVRMADPRTGPRPSGAAREIVSPWYELPEPVVVPADVRWYVVDQNLVDQSWGARPPPRPVWERRFDPQRQVMLQAHRWVSYAQLREWVPSKELFFGMGTGLQPPFHRTTTFPVSDWVVAERFSVTRGDYIERPLRVEVPVWRATRERFELAQDPEVPKRTRGVEIDFGDASRVKQPGTILVDFTGGTVTHERRRPGMKPVSVTDASQVEVLALTSDGKLVVRQGGEDTEDSERNSRLYEYRERIEHLWKAARKEKR